MLEKINLIDMSALVLSGCYSTFGGNSSFAPKDARYNGIPTGGIYQFFRYLLTPIYKNAKPSVLNIACFDCVGPTFRHLSYPDYKGRRRTWVEQFITKDTTKAELLKMLEDYYNNPEVCPKYKSAEDEYDHLLCKYGSFIQLQILYEMLESLGCFHVLRIDAYEADDLILNITASFPQTEIILYADDKDYAAARLYHDSDTFMQYSVSGRKWINPPFTPFSTQIIKGLSKDGIPSISKELGKAVPIVRDFLEDPMIDNYQLLEEGIIENTYSLSQKQGDLIRRNMKLVYPADVPLPDVSSWTTTPPDYVQISQFASLFGLNNVLSSLKLNVSKYPNENDIILNIYKQMYAFVREEYCIY